MKKLLLILLCLPMIGFGQNSPLFTIDQKMGVLSILYLVASSDEIDPIELIEIQSIRDKLDVSQNNIDEYNSKYKDDQELEVVLKRAMSELNSKQKKYLCDLIFVVVSADGLYHNSEKLSVQIQAILNDFIQDGEELKSKLDEKFR